MFNSMPFDPSVYLLIIGFNAIGEKTGIEVKSWVFLGKRRNSAYFLK